MYASTLPKEKPVAAPSRYAYNAGRVTVQRLTGDLRDRVPDRHLDRADRDRALAVAAGLFPLHHDGEDLPGIEIGLRLVEQRVRIGSQKPRDEARAHRGSAGIAPGRVEGEADNPSPLAHDIRQNRHDRRRHLGKIEARIADVRFQWDRAFADVDDTHRVGPVGACSGEAWPGLDPGWVPVRR